MKNTIVERLAWDVPMMTPAALGHLLARDTHPQDAEPKFLQRIREGLKPEITMADDGIAIVPIAGPLARRPSTWDMLFYDLEDSEHLEGLVNAAANSGNVRGIVLDIDSPGGFHTGGPELADAVARAAARKPTVAWTGTQMASLAYMVGSQASQIVSTRSAIVGSIGAYIALTDRTKFLESLGIKVELFTNAEAKFKAIGLVPLTDEQRDHLRGRAQAAFDDFRSLVKDKRRHVKPESMQGQTFHGHEAIGAGLVDAIGSRGYAISVARSMAKAGWR